MRRFVAFVVVLGSLGLLSVLPSNAGAASDPALANTSWCSRTRCPTPTRWLPSTAVTHQADVSHVYHSALKGYVVTIPADRLGDIRSDSRVDYVEADGVAYAFGKPGGSVPPPQQIIPPGVTAVGAEAANTVAGDHTGAPVDGDLYVIDKVDTSHPDLNVVEFRNFAGGQSKDCNGHGTHVAGTAAAKDNTSYVVGVAPGTLIHAIKVLSCAGYGYDSGIIAGIDWGSQPRRRGGGQHVARRVRQHRSRRRGTRNSAASGVLYVLAAGNEHVDVCTTSPARWSGGGPDNGIVTVGAVDSSRSQASVSNFGSCVDIWAPGVSVLSTWPRSATRVLNGTSMAAPGTSPEAGSSASWKGRRSAPRRAA